MIRSFVKKIYRGVIPPHLPVLPLIQRILGQQRMVGVDVGGACGMLPHWVTLNGAVYFYLFEPHAASFNELKESIDRSTFPDLFKVLPVGLSGTGGKRTLHMTNAPTGSSILPLDPERGLEYAPFDYIFPIRETEIDTETLSAVMDRYGENRIDLIKLDIQGAELEVLKSMGMERLSNLLVAEIEIGLVKTHVGQGSLVDFEQLMNAKGMELFDVRVARVYLPLMGKSDGYQKNVFHTYFNPPGLAARSWEFDGIYFRRPKLLIQNQDVLGIRRLMVAYCAYNFFSQAHHLATVAHDNQLFSKSEINDIHWAIEQWFYSMHFKFYYRPSMAFERVRRLLDRLSFRGSHRWAQHMWVSYPNS